MRISLTHGFVSTGARSDRSILRGLWRLADPKIALASLVPFCTGAALVWREIGDVPAGLALAAFVAIFLVEVGKNATNDLYDFRSGADTGVLPEERTPYSGGKRVLIDGVLTERDLVVIAWIAFGAAAITGTEVALATNPALLVLGAVAALVSVLYAMPPVQLSYRGLGELAVFSVYGPGILLGTVLLFAGSVTAEVVAASIVLGILIALVLLVNELPDERADREAGKRTLVVRLGRERATSLIIGLFLLAFAIAAGLSLYGDVTFFAGALAGAPVAAVAGWRLVRQRVGPPVAAQTATLAAYVATGLGLAAAAIVV